MLWTPLLIIMALSKKKMEKSGKKKWKKKNYQDYKVSIRCDTALSYQGTYQKKKKGKNEAKKYFFFITLG